MDSKSDINTEQKFPAKYYQIKMTLLQDIHDGRYPSNAKLPSNTELMQKYNIARATAKRVIQELINEGIVYTVQGKGSFVSDYQLSDNKKKSHEPDIKRIVFITSNISEMYFSRITQGMLDILQKKDYSLEICYSNGDYKREIKLLSRYLKDKVSGIIFVPAFNEGQYNHLFQIQKTGIPIVLMSNYLQNFNFDYVGISDYKGTKDAVRHLVKLGHKDIIFLGGGLHLLGIKERLEAYKEILTKSKIKINEELILSYNGINYDTPEIEGYMRMKEFLTKKIEFTAIFSKNDEIALGAYKALKEKGIRVPEDVSLIGYDDNIARYFDIPLTSVRQDIYHLGYYAAKLILKRLDNNLYKKPVLLNPNGKEKIILNTELIIRKSTKKINKSRIKLKAGE